MKTCVFADLYDFTEHIEDIFFMAKESCDDFIGISIVAPYDPMIEILNALVKETEFKLFSVDIADCIVCGYDSDFILQIDFDGNLWMQRTTYDNGNIVNCDDNFIFVSEDANSKFIAQNRKSNIVCFEFVCDEFDCDDDLFSLEEASIFDDDVYGFTASKSDGNNRIWCSFYSSEKLDKDDYKELLREFGFSK